MKTKKEIIQQVLFSFCMDTTSTFSNVSGKDMKKFIDTLTKLLEGNKDEK